MDELFSQFLLSDSSDVQRERQLILTDKGIYSRISEYFLQSTHISWDIGLYAGILMVFVLASC